jgi:DNA polymerase
MRLTLDYETRSPCDLKKCGEWVYAEHPYTEIMCCAVKVGDEKPMIWLPESMLKKIWAPGIGTPIPVLSDAELFALLQQADEIEAHNAGFERAMWSWCATRKYGWPEPDPKKFRCSLAKCAYHALPRSLDQAAKSLELPLQKDMAGNKLMLKMCKPRKPLKKEIAELVSAGCRVLPDGAVLPAIGKAYYLWHEKPEDIVRLCEYCLQDVETEHAVSKALPDLTASELAVWQLDQEINARGIQIDQASVEKFISEIGKFEQTLLAETKALTNGAVGSPKQIEASLKWLALMGLGLPDLTKNTVAEALGQPDLPPQVRRFLEIRKQLGRASTAKYDALRRAASSDGRIRGTMRYHGAATGRFSGRIFQPQNLPRGVFSDSELCINTLHEYGFGPWFEALYEDFLGAASTCIRGMLIAKPGHDLISADFSSIEARVNAWIAGEQAVLQAFLDKQDLYKVAAAQIFNVDYLLVDKNQRQTGKCSELALGYGGGIGAYAAMASNYQVDLEALPTFVFPIAPEDVMGRARGTAETYCKKNPDGMSYDAATACDIIKQLWRQKRPNIVALWAGLEEACGNAVISPGKVWAYRGVKYLSDGQFLRCKLPSGRCLHYYKPSVKEKETPWGQKKQVVCFWGLDSMTGKFLPQHLYGGLLCENAVQATSRDILTEALLRLEAQGYPPVIHVHDEAVSEVPVGFGSVEEYETIMAQTPAWAVGCPIAAEGWRGPRYKK